MGGDPLTSLASQSIEVDGVELRVAPLGGVPSGRFLVLVKPLAALDGYRALFARYPRPRILELGIAYGGSVAFNALTADPSRLVAVELSPARIELLDDLVAARGWSDVVRLHYGVNQADRERLVRILAEELPDGIDVAIDDASHLYAETVTSFEVVFPHVRPGGSYVIEDWSCDDSIRRLLAAALADPSSPIHPWAAQTMAGAVPSANEGEPPQSAVAVGSLGGKVEAGGPTVPLSRLAAQLALGPTDPSSGIASVSIDGFTVVVERSDAPLDPATFTLATACPDPFAIF